MPPLEIERKFLIRMPSTARLLAEDGVRVKEMVQTYLSAPAGVTARVREVREAGGVRYIYTEKRRLTALTAEEEERELDEAAYEDALARRDESRSPIKKTRYAIPYAGHTVEIDIYPFWQDRAILEVELTREDEEFALPPYLTVLAEVTADRRYKNVMLAREVPHDPLTEEEA